MEFWTPPSGPPQGPPPSKEIFAHMGEEAIFRMCRDFYARLHVSEIGHMFPADHAAASEKLACFLVGLFGGPPLFHERYGAPRMRARHLPFAIDQAARRAWLRCMEETLEGAEETYGFPAQHLPTFRGFVREFSAWMVNREG
jgi:hemoglobin